MTNFIVDFVRDYYSTDEFIPLHEPRFDCKEKEYLLDTIDSTFVSSVGKYVDEFEERITAYSGTSRTVVVVNGTAALYAALYECGVEVGDVVITQALTFVATANAVSQLKAKCAFVDVSKDTLGMCPQALEKFLIENAELIDDVCHLKVSREKIKAVVPMHTFGHPVEIDRILEICTAWNINVVEDAAESLGSFYKDQHTGTFGRYGTVSFNGNKIITTGGGGAVLCSSTTDGEHLKYITTTAKKPHKYRFFHDEHGFNFRMPNLNAALGCAQLSKLDKFLANKRNLANEYRELFSDTEYQFFDEPKFCKSNFWFNTVICENLQARDRLLKDTNDKGVMTRPIWDLMIDLPMYKDCLSGDLSVSRWLVDRVINLPSSVRI